MPQAFTDEQGLPVLLPAIAAFLDVLGTRERAATLTSTDVRHLIDTRSRYLYMLDNEHVHTFQRMLSFTDNLLIGYADSSDESLLISCFNAASYQLGMALEGQFMRGGVASGPLYIGEGLAHGQALIDAYDLESRVAQYPRIVLSPGLRRRASRLPEGLPESVNDVAARHLFITDQDGQVFLDYLSVMSDFANFEESGLANFALVLVKHRTAIESNLMNATQTVREKYVWVADYHNWVVKERGLGSPVDPTLRLDRDPDPRTFSSLWK